MTGVHAQPRLMKHAETKTAQRNMRGQIKLHIEWKIIKTGETLSFAKTACEKTGHKLDWPKRTRQSLLVLKDESNRQKHQHGLVLNE